jgi:hypothetical protein
MQEGHLEQIHLVDSLDKPQVLEVLGLDLALVFCPSLLGSKDVVEVL